MLIIRCCTSTRQRWTMNVYHPLHTKVTDQLRGPRHDNMVMTRHMMYMAYLEHRNRKKDVFLDEAVDPPRGYQYVQQHRLWLHVSLVIGRYQIFSCSRGARDHILEVMDTSCYFWLSCILLNFKPSRIIFQRAIL